MKKIALALVIVLMVSSYVFGQQRRPAQAGAAAAPLNQTGKLTVQVFDRGSDGGRTQAHNNAWTNWIKDKVKRDLNIDITFIPVGRWSEEQDITNLMASSSAPDLCYTYNLGMINTFRDQGGIMDLAPYINSYLPDLRTLLGSDPSFPGKELIYRDADPRTGRIYSVVSYRVAIAQRNVFIRKDWLDKLGMPVPTNFNQLYQALIAFRDRDPGGVGRNRVVPFGVNNDVRWGLADLIRHFMDPNMNDRDRWVNVVADRHLNLRGYKRGVQEMNKWYNEGLLFKDFPLMTTADAFYNQIKSGVVGAFCQNWDFPYRTDINITEDLRKNVPGAEYVPIAVTNNREVMDKPGLRIFVPNFSPNKDSALKYLNWLAKPENYRFLQIGTEGVNHQMVNNIPRTLSTPPGHQWFQNSPNNIDLTMPMNGVELGNDDLNGRALGFSYGSTSPATISNAYQVSIRGARGPAVWQATTRVNQYDGDLREKADDLLSSAISAKPSDFNRIWDNGMRDWMRSGAQEVLKERDALYPKKL
jgi:putative aldouronate transport system substrate-binding protein